MKKNPSPLAFDRIYYVMTSAVQENFLFNEDSNYPYFLDLLHKYISPLGDVLAFCLLPDQVHILMRIDPQEALDKQGILKSRPSKFPSLQFSHLFNAYAQALRIRYRRKGGLFRRPFYRKRIEYPAQLEKCTFQIHKLPTLSGFSDDWRKYEWTSRRIFDPKKYQTALQKLDSKVSFDYEAFNAREEKFRSLPAPIF